MKKSKLLLYSLILIQSAPIFANTAHLNVYSFRKYELIEPVIKKFETQHNIKVNVVNGKSKHLLARLKEDGENSLADVILSSDLVQLHDHKWISWCLGRPILDQFPSNLQNLLR